MTRIYIPTARKGGLVGILRAAWTAPTTFLGHLFAKLAGCPPGKRIGGHGASACLYRVPLKRLHGLGAISIGHVVIVEPDFIAGREPWILAHELSHTRQHDLFGPGYLPIHAFFQIMSVLVYMVRPMSSFPPQHAYNPLERALICVPFDVLVEPQFPSGAYALNVLQAFGLIGGESGHKLNPAKFIQMADEIFLPALLGSKYAITLSRLYWFGMNLYSIRNSIRIEIKNTTVGMLWFVSSRWITFFSILTLIAFFEISPLAAMKVMLIRRSRLTVGLDKNSAYLLAISTLPACRHKGIGSRLLLEMEELVGKTGKSCVELDVAEQNTQAIKFYLRNGYRPVFKHSFHQARLHSIYLRMKKDL